MTKSSTKRLLFFFLSLFVLTNCQDKFDEYYDRPGWLAPPIYQQLESRGNFRHFLAAIDKAGYKQALSGAGYWTIFAPNDAAFERYFQENNIAGVEAMTAEQVRRIVNYALVYNAFTKDQLADYQSPTGWVQSNAFRRRTTYYTGVYTGTIDGQPAKLIAANRNAGYFFGDNNNKYVPYFIDEYFSVKNLSAADYNYFFPNTNYKGFNVLNAAVVNADIRAENGVVHEVDQVLVAQPSIDEYLADKPQYSLFRELLDKYGLQKPLQVNQQVSDRYRVLTGQADPVYVKSFQPALAFAPNNENFLKQADNDGQMDSWSVFVPTNEVLTNYINNVLLEHYEPQDKSLDNLSPQILYDFLNAHLWQTAVWPSKFATPNFVGEPARFNPQADVVDAKVLSNGMFYGTNKVQESDAFHSVFGKAYLDPKFNLMTRLLQRELRYTLSNPNSKYALILLSDKVLEEAGYKFDPVANSYLYNNSPTQALERLTRLVNMHVVLNRFGELNDLSGEGVVETYGGEFIKYKDGRFYGAGNEDSGQDAVVTGSKPASNGLVYYADRTLLFPENKPLGAYIRDRGDVAGKPYYKFYEYLKRSALYNAANHEISGVAAGVFYTAFIPTNAAMDAAVTAGVLPANPATSNGDEKEKINRFLQYHILAKKTIAANGAQEGGAYESLYKTLEGGVTTLRVAVTSGPIGRYSPMTVTDMRQRTANVVSGANSNVLATRALIHQIDNYLQYVD